MAVCGWKSAFFHLTLAVDHHGNIHESDWLWVCSTAGTGDSGCRHGHIGAGPLSGLLGHYAGHGLANGPKLRNQILRNTQLAYF